MRVEVRLEARLTEDKEKVLAAVKNFFDLDEILEEREKYSTIIRGFASSPDSLSKLYKALRRFRILDAARQYLLRGREAGGVRFYLNKQVAYVGKISFCSFEYGESPLGAISVFVKTSSPERFIDWLTPRTVDGRPVGEEAIPEDP